MAWLHGLPWRYRIIVSHLRVFNLKDPKGARFGEPLDHVILRSVLLKSCPSATHPCKADTWGPSFTIPLPQLTVVVKSWIDTRLSFSPTSLLCKIHIPATLSYFHVTHGPCSVWTGSSWIFSSLCFYSSPTSPYYPSPGCSLRVFHFKCHILQKAFSDTFLHP